MLKVYDDGTISSNPASLGITPEECFKVEHLGYDQPPQAEFSRPAVYGQPIGGVGIVVVEG